MASSKIDVKKSIIFTFLLGVTMILLGILSRSYSALTPISSVTFTSSTLNYEQSEPGSWQVVKSAEWIRSDQIEIIFQASSVMQEGSPHQNYILMFDTAASLDGESLQALKDAAISFSTSLLDSSSSTVSIITFGVEATVFLDPTDNLEEVVAAINRLSTEGQQTSYYKAFQTVEKMFQSYDFLLEDCQIVFISDGYPNMDSPNERGEYQYLKSEYPDVTISAIQYQMYQSEVITAIDEISDFAFLASNDTIERVLLKISNVANTYDSFVIDDAIADSFHVSSIDSIHASVGDVELVSENNVQRVIWNMADEYVTGSVEELHIVADYISSESVMPTNQKTVISFNLGTVENQETFSDSPVLSTSYTVNFLANAPDGCSVSNLPSSFTSPVFQLAKIGTQNPSCNGYVFQGWKIKETDTVLLNDNYFIMPSHDVTLVAVWSNLSLSKSMDGEVYTYKPPVLQAVAYNYTGEIWKYRSQIAKIVLQNSFQEVAGAIESYDISASQNGSVKAYITLNPDDSSTYIVYIQGDGGLIANENSSYLFYAFSSLVSIEGLEYLDTSNVTSMGSMFANDSKLTTLDVSHFDTSKVTDFSFMFAWCESLQSLDVTNFQTENATNIQYMFCNCNSLQSLNVSSFNTSNVVYMGYTFSNCGSLTSLELGNFQTQSARDMSYMFNNCTRLTELDLSSFNTSNVTNMSYMFYGCQGLTNLDLINFDTSKVTNMAFMFAYCYFIETLNVSSFDTSNVVDMSFLFASCNNVQVLDVSEWRTGKVTNMTHMFNYCQDLQTVNVSNFDTSKVTNMERMFRHCESLTSLNVSTWNTSNVTNMTEMFADMFVLQSLDVSNFNTAKVTTMKGMFMQASKLKTLNVSNFDTSNVTDMSYMFGADPTINNSMAFTSITFGGNFDTSMVTTMKGMFYYNSNLTTLQLNGFSSDSQRLQDVSYMFASCHNLKSITFFVIYGNVNYSHMFSDCWSITYVDIQYFVISASSDLSYMFNNCYSLTELNQRSGVHIENATNASYMFNNCGNLYVNNLYLPDTGLVSYDHLLTGVQGAVIHHTTNNEAIVDAIIAEANNSNISKV